MVMPTIIEVMMLVHNIVSAVEDNCRISLTCEAFYDDDDPEMCVKIPGEDMYIYKNILQFSK